MKRIALSTALLVAAAAVACGGSDSAEESTAGAPAGNDGAVAAPAEMVMPDWYQIDDAATTVTLDITAGATPDQNYWNFNGFTKANMGTITVPVGYTVTLNLINQDPNMAHSIGVEEWRDMWNGTVEVGPVFDGAVTSNPGSLTDATMPGESETIQFVVDAAGEYALVCYVPGHAQLGMVVRFVVSADGTSGVMM